MKDEDLKPFNITLNLTDEEHKEFAGYAGKCGLNMSELLENFIADLVGSDRRNGSDEQDLAAAWYDRCGFSFFPRKTLISYFCGGLGYTMSEFVDTWLSIADVKTDIADQRKMIENASEEWEPYKDTFKTLADFNAHLLEDLDTMLQALNDEDESLTDIEKDFAEYMGGETYNWDEECKNFIEWYKSNVGPVC
jgi:hypothetical protein